jgi:hypothetical protein
MIGNNMKNTFKIFSLFVILFSSIIKAELVTTELSPPEPLVNESFYLTFKVKMTGDSDPYITFTPSNVQVLGKREQGVSIQTTVVNGKISTAKEQNPLSLLISLASSSPERGSFFVESESFPSR